MWFKTQSPAACDVLIIGGGGAGLRAAIAAASEGADVLMISKARIGFASNTYLSKAVMASSGWGAPEDGSRIHGEDTLSAGRFLNDPGMVALLTERIHGESRKLMDWGAAFNCDENGSPAVIKVAGHTYARHLFGKNWKGSDLVLPLRRKAVESGVRFLEKAFVTALIKSGDKVCGAAAMTVKGEFLPLKARSVVLTTGGFGQVFLNTNNAPGITGDGHALAVEAGASLQDMEFVQFYPTALGKRGSRLFLYEKILMQDGAAIKNRAGEDILKKHGLSSPDKVTRDQFCQCMVKEEMASPGQPIFMDLQDMSEEAAKELAALIPPAYFEGQTAFPVIPTTHFCMGGVVVDQNCETACPGLFAAGEVCAGAHGANRLGGNALAEVMAMGSLAGEAAARYARTRDEVIMEKDWAQKEKSRLENLFSDQGPRPSDLVHALKKTMWANAGIVRDRDSLETALSVLKKQKNEACRVNTPGDLIRFLEFRNMSLVGEAVCRSALERTESRGSHFRKDFPDENDHDWLRNVRLKKTSSGFELGRLKVSKAG